MGWDLVIFDCDGVLVDSEPIANRILAEMLRELGLDIDYEQALESFVGRSMSACLETIERSLGRRVPDDFVRRYNERSFAAFRRELKPIEGVEQALRRIRTPVCVASSASHEKMRTTLGITGLLGHFEGRMFSATEVGRGKPDPALFLHAARAMDAQPRACAVIEDTLVGVEAGRSAGMTVFALARTDRARALSDAGAHVFHGMEQLASLLEAGPPL